VQLSFAHRTFQTQQQAIVEQRRMVDAVVVANQRVCHAAEFQQAIPVGVVPGQARNLQSQHDAHVSQRHFAGQASEAGAFIGAGAGQAEIFIDDNHLLLGPAQLAGSVGQGILAGGGFAVMFDLTWRGLANVYDRGAVDVRGLNLGNISHWFPPDAFWFASP
jgi:hypothetical protein